MVSCVNRRPWMPTSSPTWSTIGNTTRRLVPSSCQPPSPSVTQCGQRSTYRTPAVRATSAVIPRAWRYCAPGVPATDGALSHIARHLATFALCPVATGTAFDGDGVCRRASGRHQSERSPCTVARTEPLAWLPALLQLAGTLGRAVLLRWRAQNCRRQGRSRSPCLVTRLGVGRVGHRSRNWGPIRVQSRRRNGDRLDHPPPTCGALPGQWPLHHGRSSLADYCSASGRRRQCGHQERPVLLGSIALELPRPMPSGLHRSGALFNILPPQVNSSRKLKVNSSRKLKAYRGGDGRS
jgi:hypothetical protein